MLLENCGTMVVFSLVLFILLTKKDLIPVCRSTCVKNAPLHEEIIQKLYKKLLCSMCFEMRVSNF